MDKNTQVVDQRTDLGIQGVQDCGKLGRNLGIEELGRLADMLPWVTPNVFIMPPHQYVVEAKLDGEEQRYAFEALRDSCAHHPNRWKAFFRAYKTKGSYLEIGDNRYWYSQVGAAKMLNRSSRQSELENIRGGADDRAVKNWCGSPYAWKREYGLECENIHRYCNLMVYEAGHAGRGGSIVCYAAMVSRESVCTWTANGANRMPDEGVEGEIRSLLDGINAIDAIPPARSSRVACSDNETTLGAVWMRQKDMDATRVATDLRWFSTAQRLEIERIFPLEIDRTYLVQLNVTPA